MFASCANNLCVNSWNSSEQVQETVAEFVPKSKSEITHLSWCKDNSYLAILQRGEKPQILSMKKLENVHVVHTFATSNVSAISFKKNTKKHLAVGTFDGEVFLYDTKERRFAKKFANSFNCPVANLEFSHDDLQLAASSDKAIAIFALDETQTGASGGAVEKLGQSSRINCIKFHSNSSKLGVGTQNGCVHIWDTNTASSLYKNQIHSSVSGISLSHSGNFLISSGKDKKICLIDLNSNEIQFRINLNQSVEAIDLNGDDKTIAIGLQDGDCCLYDLNFIAQPLTRTKLHENPVSNVKFTNSVKDICVNSASNFAISESTSMIGDNNRNHFFEGVKQKFLDKIEIGTIDELENQLKEHCSKFNAFLNNEFKMIDEIMKDKWEVFGDGDFSRNSLESQSESDYQELK